MFYLCSLFTLLRARLVLFVVNYPGTPGFSLCGVKVMDVPHLTEDDMAEIKKDVSTIISLNSCFQVGSDSEVIK